jgi:hypothetical protein
MFLPQARVGVLGSLFASLLLLGCGSSSGSPKDGGTGGSLGGAGGAGGSSGPGTGGLGGAAGSGTAGAPMPTGSLVFTGDQAGLLTQGPPCTSEVGATGDRWCAFVAASVTNPGNGDLFVVNVTKAAAGVSISCGATDANCIKLTSNYGENEEHPANFGGDTLVYYEFSGTPFGWRPGMTAGRALATADPLALDVVFCTPSTKGTAIYCLRILPAAMQTDPTLLLTDLLAGKLDGAANPPLARVETIIAVNDADAISHFQIGFPVPGGDTIAWSARPTATGPETLKMQTIGNDASRVTVASGINSWTASPDGTRWYWLSAVNETSGAGALQSAPYPGGAGPVALASNIIQYDFPTPTSLLAVATDTAKSMLAFADPVGAPTTSQTVDTGVIAFVALSKQAHAAYVKAMSSSASGTTFTDMFVKKTDGTGACAITSTTNSFPFDAIFTPSAGGLAWIQRGATAIQAQFTRLSDCMAMNVGSNVVWTEPIGDRAVLYWDTFNNTTQTGALKFRTLAAGAVSADPAAQISGQVATFAVLPVVVPTGGADAVVYTVNAGGNDDGVYVRPFGP